MKIKVKKINNILVLLILVFLGTVIFSKAHTDLWNSNFHLEDGFVTPTPAALPQVYWWWLNSNIDRKGAARDIEEMKRQSIGGALIFDAAGVDRWRRKDVISVPVGPAFMSPKWQEVFRHAVEEASRLGLELGVSMTSGFNAGGPWVTPEYGQQELVWSELVLKGPMKFSGKLPLPSGPIYDNNHKLITYGEMKVNNDLTHDSSGKPVYYRDVAVLAVPLAQLEAMSLQVDSQFNVPPGRLKHWALKSVHSFNYPEDRGFLFDIVYDNIPDIQGEPYIDRKSIYKITNRINRDGYLNWTVPKGKWLILRFGHTYTGVMLQATNPHNRGLAMDHLSAKAASRHFAEIGEDIIKNAAEVDRKSLKYLYLDSWEVRIANWTTGFLNEFRTRRGYDMTPYLPILAGRIVENRDISNRFLHDYRKTIGDLIADNYYGQFRYLCHKHGLEFHAEMSTTPIPVDMLKCLGRCDVPVGEFWAETDLKQGRFQPWKRMFGKQAASAAHIYGFRLAAAEALTVIDKHWEQSAFQLKRTIDQAFCSGINSLIIHTFTHSPKDVGLPGYEYFAGTHFNPQITWWKQAHAFTEYIGRSQFLLQQGHFVADVCFYEGGQIPNFVPTKHIDPNFEQGYDYDVVNSEVILKRMSVCNGKIVLPDGMSYRLLVLPKRRKIDPEVLKKIAKLIHAGATVIGPKPSKAYGLTNYPANDSLVSVLANEIWGNCDGRKIKERCFGKGKIVWGKTPREILFDMGILQDFEYSSPSKDTKLDYIHRSMFDSKGHTEIYFIANLKNRWENIECTFRVKDLVPEIWNPETGKIHKSAIYVVKNKRTTLPLRLSPSGSVFVVFRKRDQQMHIIRLWRNSELIFPATGGKEKAASNNVDVFAQGRKQLLFQTQKPGNYQFIVDDGSTLNVKITSIPQPIYLTNPWIVHFPSGWGAPDSCVFKKLVSWTELKNPGIKYFSGTATYSRTFEISKNLIHNRINILLDLGNVKDVAEVILNKKYLGIFWKPSFELNITSAIRPGQNKLIVRVTNLWPNRISGDQFLPKEKRFTFTNIKKFTRDSSLLTSGLIGPVSIRFSKRAVIREQN